ncbi:MAG: riboflavin synthase [Rickettsiales bacterium]|nr:riboflavin synthase [Rickettsiales bacterium]
MFTGIITDVGIIDNIKKLNDYDIEIVTILNKYQDIKIGDSIANNGVCLTVTELNNNKAKFFISKETIRCSNFGNIEVGSLINIEQSLKLSDGLSGHLVSGHVDYVAEILNITKAKDSYEFIISISPDYRKYFIDKGSVAINGISLTVNKVLDDNKISLNIIPHTLNNTNLKNAVIGDRVNIEVDMVAKYILGSVNVYTKK